MTGKQSNVCLSVITTATNGGFLLERGITVRQGLMPFRKALPEILSAKSDVLSARMINLIGELSQDWRRLDERIASVSTEIEAPEDHCQCLTRARSGPPRGCPPPLSATVAHHIG
jgi:hypothetical protein